jgi:predicted ATPase/class 3 adenylate cyclase
MTFNELLAQVRALLQREQRVSYRALKRRFDLDDDYLEDVKDELIYAKKLAVDEENRVLVWTGDAGKHEGQSIATPPTQAEVTQHIRPSQAELPPTEPPLPEAERRQLTVMFCDLVDSTKLSSQLDPEDYREVVRAYQATCTKIIQRYDGHVAQLLGDGLLVYFGYPQAREDDAHRAVRTGLEILEAMEALNNHIAHDKGIRLAVRLGVHTGLVVIGEMGGEGCQEQLALGDVPNIAARLEGLAQPDTVVVSPATYRLTHGYFDCDALGEQPLRGMAEPMAVYRVRRASGAQSHLDIAVPRGLPPLVGRASEVMLLLERWAHAKEGQGQVVLLSGEAGIGKSRLVQVLKDQVAGEPHTRLECRSLPYYQHSALYPIIELLPRLLPWQHDASPDEQLDQLAQALRQYRLPEQETMPLLAPLLSLAIPEDRYPPLTFSPERQRQKTFEVLLAVLLEVAAHRPVLFILEDVHWTDPSTLELLDLLMDQIPTVSLCALLTCRRTFQPSWSPRSYLTQVTLNRLSRQQSERMAEQVAGGKRLPAEVLRQVVEKTDGVPLFVEEMTKAILESGYLKEIDAYYEVTGTLPALAIPATLHDSLMARLDRLVTAKAVAQYAAVLGRHFSYAVLHAVSQLDEPTLQRELGRLVDAELLYQRGLPPQATYLFKHALIRDIAYESLLRSTRQGYHQRVTQVLAAQFPETAATQPELLAQHCTEAGLNAPAVRYWYQAGQHAIQRSAHAEAVAHLTKGLEVLKTLPNTSERTQQELDVQITLGQALTVTKGYAAPEVEHTYTRARQLCQQVGETPQLFPVLRGLWNFYLIRREVRTARELAEQLLGLAQHAQDPALLQQAHSALAGALVHLGAFAAAQAHLQQGLALYDPPQHRTLALRLGYDLGVFFLAYMTRPLWLLGYPDQALQRSHETLTLAQELAHPFSLAYALTFAAWIHQFRREGQATHARAEALCALAREQGFAMLLASGPMHRGWALAEQGQSTEGMVQIREGLAAYRATGSEVDRAYFLALLAEAYGRGKRDEEGLAMLDEALALTDQQASVIWEAEFHRLKGELLLARSAENQVEAEACFHEALAVSRCQQAKSLELRAAMSLARLWQHQGKIPQAHDLLAPVYTWFTEGFETADLQEAKALLDALAC